MEKQCSKCLEIKSLHSFTKDKAQKSGLRPSCRDCVSIYSKNRYSKESGLIKERSAEWRLSNPSYKTKWDKENPHHNATYYKENKKELNERSKERYSLKKTSIIKQQNEYCKQRRETDVGFKISGYLRSRLTKAIKNNAKNGSAVKDLGCTIEQLKQHFELLFVSNMSWDNYGEWHIDHIKPLSSFDLTNPAELKKACHYTNLQPLWAKDNLKKGKREI